MWIPELCLQHSCSAAVEMISKVQCCFKDLYHTWSLCIFCGTNFVLIKLSSLEIGSNVSEIHPRVSYQQNCTDIWGLFNDSIDYYTKRIAELCVHLPSFNNEFYNGSKIVPCTTSSQVKITVLCHFMGLSGHINSHSSIIDADVLSLCVMMSQVDITPTALHVPPCFHGLAVNYSDNVNSSILHV